MKIGVARLAQPVFRRGAAVCCVGLLLSSCARPTGRAASPAAVGYELVYRAARGVRAADTLCARMATERHDLALARRCADAYDGARAGLLAAEAVLDAWAEAREGDLGCAAGRAAEGMVMLGDALVGAGLAVPAELTESTRLAVRLVARAGAGACGTSPPPQATADGGADG